jgi:hypothetical protein
MDSRKRNVLILAGLLGVWGLIFTFRPPWGSPPRPEARVKAPAHPQSPAARGGGLPRLKRELLNLPAPAYPPEVQNIFGSLPAAQPPQAAVVPGTLAPPPPPPPDPFQEEAKRLRYVGFLLTGERTVAFIVASSEVHTVEVGATIKERFRVQAITEDALLLSSVDGVKQVRLPLALDAAAPPRR